MVCITLQSIARNSWFWQRQRAKQKETQQHVEKSLAEFLQSSQIHGGRETIVGGRRCPAHEDAVGFADALVSYLYLDLEPE